MKKTHENEMTDTRAEIVGGSVYEQLGYKRITQTKAAEILGIFQPKLSGLLSGRFRGFSVERLINFLNELGKDVDIVVKTKPRNRKEGRTNVYGAGSTDRTIIPVAAKGK